MKLKRAQWLAVVLIVFGIAIDFLGWFAFAAPQPQAFTSQQAGGVGFWKIDGYPAVFLQLNFLFKAAGPLSVGTPIDVRVTVSHVNISNFLDSYNAISLTGAVTQQAAQSPSATQTNTVIPLSAESNGSFVGEKTLVWLQEGPTWAFPFPSGTVTATVSTDDFKTANPVLTVASYSDTLAQANNVITQKLQWLFIGFSLFALAATAFEYSRKD